MSNRAGRHGILQMAVLLSAVLVSNPAAAQQGPTTHHIFMSAVEIKGATSADKLSPPSVDPRDLSKGYGFKAPGQIDPHAPKKWQVASYVFVPSYVTVRQGDTVELTVFVVNGDEHDARIVAPDGRVAVPETTWKRGRQYDVSFVAEQVGTYQLGCSHHAPTMVANFLVLPRFRGFHSGAPERL